MNSLSPDWDALLERGARTSDVFVRGCRLSIDPAELSMPPDWRERYLKRRIRTSMLTLSEEELVERVFVAVMAIAGLWEARGAHSQVTAAFYAGIVEGRLKGGYLAPHGLMLPYRRIVRAVCDRYGCTDIDIKSKRRTKEVIIPRQVTMFLCRTLTTRSMPEIGRKLGGKDHTTVLHAVNKIGALLQSDAKLHADVEAIKARLI
jgi:Bacterial dnaA protein helix-turn-helix